MRLRKLAPSTCLSLAHPISHINRRKKSFPRAASKRFHSHCTCSSQHLHFWPQSRHRVRHVKPPRTPLRESCLSVRLRAKGLDPILGLLDMQGPRRAFPDTSLFGGCRWRRVLHKKFETKNGDETEYPFPLHTDDVSRAFLRKGDLLPLRPRALSWYP